MKPAPFDYRAPATLGEAVRLLASNLDATVIAGGQSAGVYVYPHRAGLRDHNEGFLRGMKGRPFCPG
jgi:hypothetical protein